jgi:hypothetical protein
MIELKVFGECWTGIIFPKFFKLFNSQSIYKCLQNVCVIAWNVKSKHIFMPAMIVEGHIMLPKCLCVGPYILAWLSCAFTIVGVYY